MEGIGATCLLAVLGPERGGKALTTNLLAPGKHNDRRGLVDDDCLLLERGKVLDVGVGFG